MAFYARVQGVRRVKNNIRNLRHLNHRRALRKAFSVYIRAVKMPNVGFSDKTGRLRNSVRWKISGTRDYVTYHAWASATYSNYVEWKKRVRQSFPGPPYWMVRIWRKMEKIVITGYKTNLAREIKRRVRSR